MSKVKSEAQIEHEDFEIIFDVSNSIEKYMKKRQKKDKSIIFNLNQIIDYLKQNTSCYKKYNKADVNEAVKVEIRYLSKGENSKLGYIPPTVAPAVAIVLHHIKPTKKAIATNHNIIGKAMPKKIYDKLTRAGKLAKYHNDYVIDNIYMIYSDLQQEYLIAEQNLKNNYDLHINDLRNSIDALIKSVMKSPYCNSDKKGIIKKYTKDIHNVVNNEVEKTQEKYKK